MIDSEHSAELERMAGRFAHDIRNPLHAIRLNLHALRMAVLEGGQLSAAELQQLFAESEQEIGRIEQRMREFLNSASSAKPNEE